MRRLVRGALAVFAAGCGGDNDSIPADAGVDAATAPVVVTGTVFSIDVGSTTYPPLAAATVCVDGTPSIPCATTSASGEYEIELPADVPLILELDAADHQGYLLGHRTLAWGPETLNLYFVTDALVAQEYKTCGGTYPEAMAGVEIEAKTESASGRTAVAGVQVDIGGGGAIGPCYWSGIEEPDPALDATTTGGIGVTQFLNVAGSSVDLTLTAADGCTTDPAWTGAGSNVVRAPLRAGFITYLLVDCP